MNIKNVLITLLVTYLFTSCGQSSGGGGGSSSNSIIPMVSNLNCGSSSCVPESLTKSSPVNTINLAGEYYEEVNDTIIPDIKSTFSEIDSVLRKAGMTSCATIPASGSTEVEYNGTTITVVAKASQSLNILNKGVTTTKAIEAYNSSSQKFFEAEFNCSTPTVAYIKGDMTILDSNNFEKFVVFFYENGNDKTVNLFENYEGDANNESYLLLFETDGTNFKSYFGYDDNIDSAGGSTILGGSFSSINGLRIISDTGTGIDLGVDSESTVSEGTSGGESHYCYNSSFSPEACTGSHPSVGGLSSDDIYDGVNEVLSNNQFTTTNVEALDFSF